MSRIQKGVLYLIAWTLLMALPGSGAAQITIQARGASLTADDLGFFASKMWRVLTTSHERRDIATSRTSSTPSATTKTALT